ncbi:MAG: 6-bladed beta-propeller [Gemmatimonadota bacterium]|nr:6-bladed beta-propeller [Gemmatimonadota bacterium]
MTVDTLPGGTVRVSNTGPLWTSETAWTLAEDLRLGTVDDSRPGEQFADIATILTDSAGRIYVLEGQAQEIRVFDESGDFSHRIGRAGEGPGELLRAAGMIWGPYGRLWVVDSRRGYAVFERDSTFVDQHPRRVLGVPRPWPAAFAGDGLLYDWVTDALERELSVRPALASGSGVEFREEGYLHPIRVSGDFETVDTLPRLEYLSGHILGLPFGDGLSVFPDRSGSVWFARSREYAIHRRTLEGDTLRVFGLPAIPAPVTPAERDSVLELTADLPSILRYDPEDIPTTKPVIRALFGDSEGHIYVVPEVEGVEAGSAVDVFREDGGYLGRMSFPRSIHLAGVRPLATRDHLYVVVTDELDVPYVERLRVVRPD